MRMALGGACTFSSGGDGTGQPMRWKRWRNGKLTMRDPVIRRRKENGPAHPRRCVPMPASRCDVGWVKDWKLGRPRGSRRMIAILVDSLRLGRLSMQGPPKSRQSVCCIVSGPRECGQWVCSVCAVCLGPRICCRRPLQESIRVCFLCKPGSCTRNRSSS